MRITARISPSIKEGTFGSAAVKLMSPADAASTIGFTMEVTSDSTLTDAMSLVMVLAESHATAVPLSVTSPFTGV